MEWWLLNYNFFYPERVPDYVIEHFLDYEWQKAHKKDSTLKKELDSLRDNLSVESNPILSDEDDEDISNNDSLPQHLTGTLALSKFPIPVLAAVYHAKKLRLFPKSDTLFFFKHKFTTDLINQSLAAFDTSPWDR
jgi:hypothetical protein